MAEADRDEVIVWAAGQLSWERRLRELEVAACRPVVDPATDPVSEPARMLPRRRRAGSRTPAH
jgi:hypothetical protein